MRDTSGSKELAENTLSGREPKDSSSKPPKLGLQEVPPTPNRDTWGPSMGRGVPVSKAQGAYLRKPAGRGKSKGWLSEQQHLGLTAGETLAGLLFLGVRRRLRYLSLKVLRNLPTWWRSFRWDHPCRANPK